MNADNTSDAWEYGTAQMLMSVINHPACDQQVSYIWAIIMVF